METIHDDLEVFVFSDDFGLTLPQGYSSVLSQTMIVQQVLKACILCSLFHGSYVTPSFFTSTSDIATKCVETLKEIATQEPLDLPAKVLVYHAVNHRVSC